MTTSQRRIVEAHVEEEIRILKPKQVVGHCRLRSVASEWFQVPGQFEFAVVIAEASASS